MKDGENGGGVVVHKTNVSELREVPVTFKQKVSQNDPAVLRIQLNKLN
jgi:hypothetical protein